MRTRRLDAVGVAVREFTRRVRESRSCHGVVPPQAAPLQPVQESQTENYMEQFWYVQHPGPHFTFDPVRKSTRVANSDTISERYTRPYPESSTSLRPRHTTN